MMGNAAIQAAERARDLLADAVSTQARRCRRNASSSPIGACSTPRRPDTRRHVRRGGLSRRSDVRHHRHRPARTRHRARPRASRAAASARRRPTPTPPRSSKWRSIPRPAGFTCRGSGSRTTSAARSTRRSCADRSRAASTWRIGEALMEEQTFRRLPAEAVARAGAQVSVDARVQESDNARHARGVHGAGREPGSARPVRREGSRSGTAAAGDAGGGQRRLRRDRRAHRRGADHAGEDPEGARRQGRGQGAALRPDALSRRCRIPNRSTFRRRGRAATGRRRSERRRRLTAERRTSAMRSARRCRDDAAAPLQLPRAAHRARGGGAARRRPAARCSSPAAPISCRT